MWNGCFRCVRKNLCRLIRLYGAGDRFLVIKVQFLVCRVVTVSHCDKNNTAVFPHRIDAPHDVNNLGLDIIGIFACG